MNLSEFAVQAPGGSLTCALATPADGNLASDPVLLVDVGGTRMRLQEQPSATARHFVEAGHRVVSFDMPNHGDLVDGHGQSIDGMRDAFLAGDDPFLRFVDNGMAVIDACIDNGIARDGRIFGCGGSRAGYCVLRLAAADRRIEAVSALAPVTDWRCLREFAAVKERQDVAALALETWAGELAGRPLFILIGNHDHRVGTHACARLGARILQLEDPLEPGASAIHFHVVDADGHAVPEAWEIEGAKFLLGRQTIAAS